MPRSVVTIDDLSDDELEQVFSLADDFLARMGDFEAMNAAYVEKMGDHRPARTTIQAAALPGVGLRVEIDCIAYIP